MWKRLGRAAGIAAIALAVLWLGTLAHESGHALVAMAFGARIEAMNVMGLDLYPALRIHHRPGYFGYVQYRQFPYPLVEYIRMAGSLSTLAVAVLAQGVLWVRPPRRTWPRLIVIGFCFSWLDLFWHTLPALGWQLPLIGSRSPAGAEVYNALLALGVPGRLAGLAVIGASVLLLLLTLARWRQLEHAMSQPKPVG